MDVQGFSRETVANATAASGLDLHYAKEQTKKSAKSFRAKNCQSQQMS
jgi:hypothetical protein